MRMRFIAATLLLLPLAPVAAASEAGDAVERMNERFMAAFNKGDIESVAEMYADHATVLPPDAQMVEGRQAIRKFWQGAVDAGYRNLELAAVRVDALGDAAAREIGRFGVDAPAKGGGMQRLEGKYVVVWTRDGDDWKLDSDIWNADHPPAAETATGSSGAPAKGTGAGK
jgi:uncharacterized protein (TIGR02246 family)